MAYTIKEVSEMMNLPTSTIRYYDKQGLIPHLERKESGYRVFQDKDIQMLKIIECFKSTGMSIIEMQKFVEMVKLGDDTLQERYELFLERRKAVEKEMEELQKQMDIIDHKIWYYKTAIEAGTEDIHKKEKTSCR